MVKRILIATAIAKIKNVKETSQSLQVKWSNLQLALRVNSKQDSSLNRRILIENSHLTIKPFFSFFFGRLVEEFVMDINIVLINPPKNKSEVHTSNFLSMEFF